MCSLMLMVMLKAVKSTLSDFNGLKSNLDVQQHNKFIFSNVLTKTNYDNFNEGRTIVLNCMLAVRNELAV